ncbi:hypothetical protein BJY04DRAFT_224517 [Aspergillus karnatakaensis]|uniref:uncharacterized protein n=1 Tax=Aspergillus karnatakaensis TaxID=1810916 RepID=UPI003CCCFB1D
MTSLFEALPAEILSSVAEILASEHHPTLQALSLVNRHCCTIANLYRFRNIHYIISGGDRGLVDIRHWEDVLAKINGFHTVRCLSVEGEGPSSQCNGLLPQSETSLSSHSNWTDVGGRHHDILVPQIVPDGINLGADRSIAEPAHLDAWVPLSIFLRRLQGLKDLFWLNRSQFPPCLLDVLHQTLPRCRLHVSGFRFDSIDSRSRGTSMVNAHESALATSPSLASVVCALPGTLDNPAHHEADIMQMAAGAAPNLSEIHIQHRQPTRHVGGQPVRDPVFFPGYTKTASRIRSLGLDDPDSTDIACWDQHIRFANLEVLSIETNSDFTVLSTVAEYSFANLQSLTLHLSTPLDTDGLAAKVARLDHDASMLLSRLPPLKRLFLNCHYTNESVITALECHGGTLKELGIILLDNNGRCPAHVILELINRIRSRCRTLRILEIRIPRTMGDASEVSIYRALGKLSHLAHLTLELDCSKAWPLGPVSMWPPIRASERWTDAQEALINVAVDEALVRAIMTLVGPRDSMLQTLKIQTVLGHMPPDLEVVAELMQSTWDGFRSLSGTSVRCADGRNKRRALDDEREDNPNGWFDSMCEYVEPFRALWPAKGGSWVDDWHSFPLQVD